MKSQTKGMALAFLLEKKRYQNTPKNGISQPQPTKHTGFNQAAFRFQNQAPREVDGSSEVPELEPAARVPAAGKKGLGGLGFLMVFAWFLDVFYSF